MKELAEAQEKGEVAWLKSKLTAFQSVDEVQEVLEHRLSGFEFHSLRYLPRPEKLLNNMESASLVCQSICRNEKIIIVGDYDADGICATCVMLDFFEYLGYANVAFAMPNRFVHGYGFSKVLFQEILQNHPDVKLIITVDNGVSSFEAGQMCRDLGIKFIITDHHTLEITEENTPKIPACDFLVNPQQENCSFPYKDICGSLVAWYFCYAIKIAMQDFLEMNEELSHYAGTAQIIRMESLLLLVGIAIISDVMPLNAINHTICKYAMKYFPSSQKCAFQVLMRYLRCNLDSQALGFRLIPLLNAAGRIDDGKIALYFLRSRTVSEAEYYFAQLRDLNAKRKALQEDVTQKAFCSIDSFTQNKDMICAVGEGWHEGVLGIVAGKMADEFQKPCFALTMNANGVCKGSGRSHGDIDLIASMQKIGFLMNRYGGHAGAVGLEISYEKLQSFIDGFSPVTYEYEKKEDVLGILMPHLINEELLGCIEMFEPYGNGNPLPKFFVEFVICGVRKVGKAYFEFRCKIQSGKIIKVMLFNPKYATYIFRVNDVLQARVILAFDTQASQGYRQQSFKKQNNVMLIIDKIYGIQRELV